MPSGHLGLLSNFFHVTQSDQTLHVVKDDLGLLILLLGLWVYMLHQDYMVLGCSL